MFQNLEKNPHLHCFLSNLFTILSQVEVQSLVNGKTNVSETFCFLHSVSYCAKEPICWSFTLSILMIQRIGSKVVWTLPSKLDGLLTEIIYSPVDTRYYRLLVLSERLRAIFEKQNSGAGYKYSWHSKTCLANKTTHLATTRCSLHQPLHQDTFSKER